MDTVQLVSRLYQRALQDLDNAKKAKSFKDSLAYACHAQEILTVLCGSINSEHGGELAMNLVRMYEFMRHQLLEAMSSDAKNFNKHIDDVTAVLRPLSEAWTNLQYPCSAAEALHSNPTKENHR